MLGALPQLMQTPRTRDLSRHDALHIIHETARVRVRFEPRRPLQ